MSKRRRRDSGDSGDVIDQILDDETERLDDSDHDGAPAAVDPRAERLAAFAHRGLEALEARQSSTAWRGGLAASVEPGSYLDTAKIRAMPRRELAGLATSAGVVNVERYTDDELRTLVRSLRPASG